MRPGCDPLKEVKIDLLEILSLYIIQKKEKNIMRMYKGVQILGERKFEIKMHLILFRNVISKFWEEETTQEILIVLIHAGMVLINIRI